MYLSAATRLLLGVEKRVVNFTDHWRYNGKMMTRKLKEKIWTKQLNDYDYVNEDLDRAGEYARTESKIRLAV